MKNIINKILRKINYKIRKYYSATWNDVYNINLHTKTNHKFKCSNCHFMSDFDYIYCPYCGCYMRNTTMLIGREK